MFKVEYMVKGASRIITKRFETEAEAQESAARWRRSNSIGSYVAYVEDEGEPAEAPSPIVDYSVLMDAEPTLDELIEHCERLYRVSYAHHEYYLTADKELYCGSYFMGEVTRARTSKEEGYTYTFVAVPSRVKL